MPDAEFVYVLYIASTPQRVWDGLLHAEFTKQYWGHVNVSDWKPGSTWEHREANASGKLKLVGKVIEFSPPKRLVMTWGNPEDAARPAAQSRVTIELEPIEGMVRLTVTHSELEADSDMHRGIVSGWPRVLSSLKSLLETGKPLSTWAKANAS